MQKGEWACAKIFFIIFTILALSISASHAEQDSSAGQVSKGPYETAIGTLEYGSTIPAGTPIKMVGGQFTYQYIFLNIPPGNGMPVGNSLDVYTGGTVTFTSGSPKITLVQDSKTGDWLGTNGMVFFIDEAFYLLEGHEIKIVGGKERPFEIAGQAYYETDVIIKDGKAVEVKK